MQQYNEFSKDMIQNGTIFTNWKCSKTPDPHRVLLNFSDKWI